MESIDFQALALIPGALDGWCAVFCEESGTIRDTFAAAGVKVFSCDLKPSRGDPRNLHYQGDMRRIATLHRLKLAIVHPDCTYLNNAGVHHLSSTQPSRGDILKGHDRWKAFVQAVAFFNWCCDNVNAEGLCLENPIMHGHAQALVRIPVTQYVQPYEHGHLETKKTGLHLRGLPKLRETNNVREEMLKLPKRETHKVHYTGQGKSRAERAEKRSVFFTGIAAAMLAQWVQNQETK